jgi:hypothetical protein
MPNQSKVNDARFWTRWKKSGAVKMFNFNAQEHPEIKSGEVFITNADASSFFSVGWKTKRRGNIALDSLGRPIGQRAWPGCFPVFAQKNELAAAGVNIEYERETVSYYEPLR